MGQKNFYRILRSEIKRIDKIGTSKRHEKIIEGFTIEKTPRAVIGGKKYYIFNSNDYLSLRHHPKVKAAECTASENYGSGPGAVRFISGTLKIHRDLEKKLAKFHNRDEAIIYSSAFAANLGVIFPLLKPQVKTSLVNDRVLVISDELNHRSIIDAIRLANLPADQKTIFKHRDMLDLERIIKKAIGHYDRLLIVSDGVFSMLGEIQNLKKMDELKKRYDQFFKNGVLTVIDDAHGVGAIGLNGRGAEEIFQTKVDILIGTLGKGLGADGGYIVGDRIIINYLRESSATYIYSNSISPGTAGAALAALQLIDTVEGKKILGQLRENIFYFKKEAKKKHIPFAADSLHPIQPVLIGDPLKTKKIVTQLFNQGFLTTAISYPVVPPGQDEIRIQLNANHTRKSIDLLLSSLARLLSSRK